MKPNQGLENRHSASIMPDLLTLFSCMVSPNLVMSVCWRGTKFQSLLPCLKPYRHCRGQSSIVTSKGCLSSYSRQPATITIVILLWAASHRIDPPHPQFWKSGHSWQLVTDLAFYPVTLPGVEHPVETSLFSEMSTSQQLATIPVL